MKEPAPLAALLIAVLIGVPFLHSFLNSPPQVVPAQAPETEFSAERALRYVAAVANEPRPIGSEAADKARRYVAEQLNGMGLEVDIQSAFVLVGARRVVAARVTNVLGRFRGSGEGRSVLLMAHVDSVPGAPGAGDDAAGVAALLETARAVRTLPALRNDIIFLFTDGEEAGLLGARAFVEQHAWRQSVDLVLNFEGRGRGGPVTMFETSTGNRWLIDQLAEAVGDPIADSVSVEIYRRMPNDTDFSPFRQSGYPGLNFAFIGGIQRYHTARDDLPRLDPRSLQHHGNYALKLVRHLGNVDLQRAMETENAVYGNFLFWFVRYPMSWVSPSLFLAVLLYAFCWVRARKAGMTGARGTILGTVLFVATVGLAGAASEVARRLLPRFDETISLSLYGQPYQADWYMMALAGVGLTLISATWYLLGKKVRRTDLTAGGLLVWTALVFGACWVAPGAHFLLFWPLMAGLASFGLVEADPNGDRRKTGLILVLSAVVISPLLGQLYFVYQAMTLNFAGGVAFLLVLSLGLLVPQFGRTLETFPRLLIVGCVATLFCGLAGGYFTRGFSPDRPRPVSLFYAEFAGESKGLWLSSDESVPSLLPDSVDTFNGLRSFQALLPGLRLPVRWAEAAAFKLRPPRAEVVSRQLMSDGRVEFDLLLKSERRAPNLSLWLDLERHQLVSVSVDEVDLPGDSVERINREGALNLSYLSLPDSGARVRLSLLEETGPLVLHFRDQSYGLPEGAPQMRPDLMMQPYPQWVQNSTFVADRLSLPGEAQD